MRNASGRQPLREWRDWLIPRSVLGMTVVILAFAIGATLSGVGLYAYYSYRLSTNEERVDKFINGFDDNFERAQKTIEAERENAKTEIEKALEPLRQTRADGETLANLARQYGKSVWFVETLDDAGQASVGSAFSVGSANGQSLLVTSYTTVRAVTRQPGPSVTVRKGNDRVAATLHTWDEDKDLALLTVDRDIPRLRFATGEAAAQIGNQVFALSGLGAAGGAATAGFVIDISASGIQHTAAIGSHFQGSPLLNARGEIVAVGSRAYDPFGFRSEAVFFGPPIRAACDRILSCPGGEINAGNAR